MSLNEADWQPYDTHTLLRCNYYYHLNQELYVQKPKELVSTKPVGDGQPSKKHILLYQMN